MAHPAITLYSLEFSPFTAKVRCYLGYKSLEYETIYVRPLKAKQDIPIGHQVPVLKIADELRNDSTPIGLWLDEKFPNTPALLPQSEPERTRLLEIDQWVTDTLVPLSFRLLILHGKPFLQRMNNRRRGAQGTLQTSGYPLPWRWLHPVLVTRIGFIKKILAQTDLNETNEALISKAAEKINADLNDSAFLGGRDAPSLPDFSAYALFALPYLAGYDGANAIEEHQGLMDWLLRVDAHLPELSALRRGSREREWPKPQTSRHS